MSYGGTYRKVQRREWAIGAFFFLFFFLFLCFYVYLIMFIGFTGIVELRKVIWEGMARRTGPNDVYFFSYFLIFFINSYLHVL